jgi:hypothetical protein
MARLGLALLVLVLASCGELRDAFSAHPRVAASAAGQDLTVDQLAGWVASVKKVQPKAENFSGVAAIYVDFMVFASQLAKGRDMDDSLLVARANWPTESQLKWNRFHDRLAAVRAHLTPAQVDSAFLAGDVRVFQHILIQVPASASPPMVEQKRATTAQLLLQASAGHGTAFGAVARRYSEDPGSKAAHGYLAPAGRGQFVAPFEVAAWELQPGAISGVVRSPFGFHVIRRPPLAEVRDSFTAGLERASANRLDSVYVDSLAVRRDLRVKSGAPALVRQVFGDLVSARTDTRTLVTYRGGAFRVRDLVRWIFAIDPGEVRFLPTASDDQLIQFLGLVTKRELLLAQVDSAGIQLTPDEWHQVKAAHDSALGLLEHELGLSAALLADSARTPAAREQLAAAHVNAYLGRALARELEFFPVPPFLAAALRESEPWSINAAGVADAVDRATALRATRDSAPPTGLRRAPGGPPVPSDTTLHRSIR